MDDWPDEHVRYKQARKSGAFYYTDETYRKLGVAA